MHAKVLKADRRRQSAALLALFTSGVNATALAFRPGTKNKNGWIAVLQHMKIICLSVGLLLALSGLTSFAASHRQAKLPAQSLVSLQAAQGSVATSGGYFKDAMSITKRYFTSLLSIRA